METQTRLNRHDKFISAENITILSVSSDDYLHPSLSSQSVCVCVRAFARERDRKRELNPTYESL